MAVINEWNRTMQIRGPLHGWLYVSQRLNWLEGCMGSMFDINGLLAVISGEYVLYIGFYGAIPCAHIAPNRFWLLSWFWSIFWNRNGGNAENGWFLWCWLSLTYKENAIFLSWKCSFLPFSALYIWSVSCKCNKQQT